MNELRLFDKEYNCIIAGVDEAGRGPLAGPVVAAAVIIEDYFEELGEINDSKKLTEKKRELRKFVDNVLTGRIGESLITITFAAGTRGKR